MRVEWDYYHTAVWEAMVRQCELGHVRCDPVGMETILLSFFVFASLSTPQHKQDTLWLRCVGLYRRMFLMLAAFEDFTHSGVPALIHKLIAEVLFNTPIRSGM